MEATRVNDNLLPAGHVGLLRIIATVCSCQSNDCSTKSRYRRGAERNGANDQAGTLVRRPRFHFHYEVGEALRLRSFTPVRMHVRSYVHAYAYAARVRIYLTRANVSAFLFLLHTAIASLSVLKIEADTLRDKRKLATRSKTIVFSLLSFSLYEFKFVRRHLEKKAGPFL